MVKRPGRGFGVVVRAQLLPTAQGQKSTTVIVAKLDDTTIGTSHCLGEIGHL
jgi:hypothetical protein